MTLEWLLVIIQYIRVTQSFIASKTTISETSNISKNIWMQEEEPGGPKETRITYIYVTILFVVTAKQQLNASTATNSKSIVIDCSKYTWLLWIFLPGKSYPSHKITALSLAVSEIHHGKDFTQPNNVHIVNYKRFSNTEICGGFTWSHKNCRSS